MPNSVRWWLIGTVVIMGALAIAYAVDYQSERQLVDQRVSLLTRGQPQRGIAAIEQYGCGGCHDIPHIAGAHGLSAPPLANFGARTYIAGELRNTPDNLVHWIMHPHDVEPKTVMPEMGVTETDARDIAAYLYTL